MKPTRQQVADAATVLVSAWAHQQREERGDAFATEYELQSILSDPLAWLPLLRGEDTERLIESLI